MILPHGSEALPFSLPQYPWARTHLDLRKVYDQEHAGLQEPRQLSISYLCFSLCLCCILFSFLCSPIVCPFTVPGCFPNSQTLLGPCTFVHAAALSRGLLFFFSSPGLFWGSGSEKKAAQTRITAMVVVRSAQILDMFWRSSRQALLMSWTWVVGRW